MKELTPLETLRKVEAGNNNDDCISLLSSNAITTEQLREDIIVEVSDVEKQLIIDSFPNKKDNYLVVPKVIEE